MEKAIMTIKTLQEQLKAAIADRDAWVGFNEIQGQMKHDDPNYESSHSCKLMRDPALRKGYTRCRNKKYGSCAFYHCRCRDRHSYQCWLEHHKQFHPEDKQLLVHNDCQECNRLRDEEVAFMNVSISKLNNKIKCMSSHADIVKEMILPKRSGELPVGDDTSERA